MAVVHCDELYNHHSHIIEARTAFELITDSKACELVLVFWKLIVCWEGR